jgi:MoxR-like ATPase
VKEVVDWGAGPRAGQFLINGAKAVAAMSGRYQVMPEDIRQVAVPVLRHRLSTNFQAQAEGLSTDDVVKKLIQLIPIPEPAKYVSASRSPPPPPSAST